MNTHTPTEVTVLLAAVQARDDRAADRLLSLVYEQLRSIAQQRMKQERTGHTLQATALVHEAYLRLMQDPNTSWDNRGHFFAAAAEAMRRILIEHARARGRAKRGGGGRRLPLSVVDLAAEPDVDQILSLDEAVCRMEQEDSELASIVRLRFYAGLSVEDTAAALKLSPATVKRRWSFARAWLYRALQG